MKEHQELAALWQSIAQDYAEIRREQEEDWASMSLEEHVYVTEQLLLLVQEIERLEIEESHARNVGPVMESTG